MPEGGVLQQAQMELILQKKPQVISDLLLNFDNNSTSSTPLFSYLEYIINRWDELNRLIIKIENESLSSDSPPLYKQVRSKALKELIPNWTELELNSKTKILYSELKLWSVNFNLPND